MSENLPTRHEGGLPRKFDPEGEIAAASRAATALKDVVVKAGLARKLGGDKEHLQFEAWQTVGFFYGSTPKVEWTKEIERDGQIIGYNARAVILRDGEIIGAAESSCSRDEEKWNIRTKYEYVYVLKDGTKTVDEPTKDKMKWIPNPKKPGKTMPARERIKTADELVPLFQLRSMAQTRAQAKALRSCYAWVVVLAGYQPTPLEEMEGIIEVEATTESDGNRGVNKENPSEDDKSPSSEAQHKAIFTLLKRQGVKDDLQQHEYVSKILGLSETITSMSNLTKQQASSAIELLQKMSKKGGE